jgi:hypothetical protein
MDLAELRRRLEQPGSYPAIEAACRSGALARVLPVELFDHIGIVYDRLEKAADAPSPAVAPLRLTVLLHEQSPGSLPSLLATAGLSDFAPIVLAVVGGFGKLWKTRTDDEIGAYVVAHQDDLASLLLFELAHEGRATDRMERAAELGGLDRSFRRWAARLRAGQSRGGLEGVFNGRGPRIDDARPADR